MSARTEAAAELISQRNRLDETARELTAAAAALVAAENAAEPPAPS
ncbi:MAG TPA: hypothetical protein VGS06_46295 [Streptosporangiaceae bacterium]|nr:hypothetical protein [Streptosporangiaceae bacterium]